MARPARGPLSAGTYHVTTRSCGPTPIFIDDEDRTRLCILIVRALRRMRGTCHAFCLVGTHYHLLVDVPTDELQDGIALLNSTYAQGFNRRHGRVGHLFGDRYRCVRVESDGHMLHLLRYIARNPVRAGLCRRPSDWIWGSYRGCVEIDAGFPFVDHSFLRSYFGSDWSRAIELIKSFVGDAEDLSTP